VIQNKPFEDRDNGVSDDDYDSDDDSFGSDSLHLTKLGRVASYSWPIESDEARRRSSMLAD